MGKKNNVPMGVEPKLTEQEGADLQKTLDLRRTKLLKEFCRQIANTPDDFGLFYQLTDDNIEQYLKPIADHMYEFMKAEGMTIQDIEYADKGFDIVYGATLSRVLNLSEAFIQNLCRKHFGVRSIADIPMQMLEDEGKVVVDPKDLV